jgi:acetyltransferase-like isoleucine patch superfamily enzyme
MAVEVYGNHTYGRIGTVGGEGNRIIVGKYCSISADVKAFMSGDHNFNVISTFPFNHPGMAISKLVRNCAIPTTQSYNLPHRLEVIIGNDVWIGHGAIIFRDTTIGDGAVIGAFAKITKDIPPYSIVVGESRILRKRFPDEDIEFLLQLKWWNWPDEDVAAASPVLLNPDVSILKRWAIEHGKWKDDDKRTNV